MTAKLSTPLSNQNHHNHIDYQYQTKVDIPKSLQAISFSIARPTFLNTKQSITITT